jgi:hypothetical protein
MAAESLREEEQRELLVIWQTVFSDGAEDRRRVRRADRRLLQKWCGIAFRHRMGKRRYS